MYADSYSVLGLHFANNSLLGLSNLPVVESFNNHILMFTNFCNYSVQNNFAQLSSNYYNIIFKEYNVLNFI